ncbi:LysR family transcriptional regulator [Egbenema bharatensis]|uniref:LysR family transcriptional regulator n=1 Tax=Egbenema bharatensis TaxID=3463334 RepID=UPI003A86F0D1
MTANQRMRTNHSRVNHQNQLKLSQLRVLVAAAACENFSEAALQLEMSQPAVSHAIAALEEHLGVVLFLRGRRGARLTPIGERIVVRAREIVQQADEIEKEALLSRGLEGGQVRLVAFRSVATHVLPSVIASFHQRFPAIGVSLTEYEDYLHVEQALRDGAADVGFTFLPASDDLQTWKMVQDEFVALFPADFKADRAEITWEELMAQPLIMPPNHSIMMEQVYAHAEAHGYQLTTAYEVKMDSTIVSLVAQGLGTAILPRLAAEPIPPKVQIYSLPVPLYRIIGAAVLADALQTPAIYAFLEVLQSLNKGSPHTPSSR